jgi:hypothetical protein
MLVSTSYFPGTSWGHCTDVSGVRADGVAQRKSPFWDLYSSCVQIAELEVHPIDLYVNWLALCCNLDLEHSPKGYVLKTWSSAWYYWEGVETCKHWSLLKGHRSLEDVSLMEILGLYPSILLPFLHPGYGTNFVPPCTPSMMCCLTIDPKAMEPAVNGLETLTLWAKINLSSL